MPSATFPSPSLSRRAHARALALITAVVALLVSGTAFAIPAPMCDEHAQSIAAPFPLLPSDNGEARASTPCEQRGSHELGRAPTPDRQNPTAQEAAERVLPAHVWALPRDRGRQTPPAEAVKTDLRPGHSLGVFRPPRES